jgi:hypothetical protein
MTKVVAMVDCMNFLIKIVRSLGWAFRIDIRDGGQPPPAFRSLFGGTLADGDSRLNMSEAEKSTFDANDVSV